MYPVAPVSVLSCHYRVQPVVSRQSSSDGRRPIHPYLGPSSSSANVTSEAQNGSGASDHSANSSAHSTVVVLPHPVGGSPHSRPHPTLAAHSRARLPALLSRVCCMLNRRLLGSHYKYFICLFLLSILN